MGDSRDDSNPYTVALNGDSLSLNSLIRAFAYLETDPSAVFVEANKTALTDIMNKAVTAAKLGHSGQVDNYMMLAEGILAYATRPGKDAFYVLNSPDADANSALQNALAACTNNQIKPAIIERFNKIVPIIIAKGALTQVAFNEMPPLRSDNKTLIKELLNMAVKTPSAAVITALCEFNAKNPQLVGQVLKENVKLINSSEKSPLLVSLAHTIDASENVERMINAVTSIKGVNLNIKNASGDTAFSVLFAKGVDAKNTAQVKAQEVALQLKDQGAKLTGAAYDKFMTPESPGRFNNIYAQGNAEAKNELKREAMMWLTMAILPKMQAKADAPEPTMSDLSKLAETVTEALKPEQPRVAAPTISEPVVTITAAPVVTIEQEPVPPDLVSTVAKQRNAAVAPIIEAAAKTPQVESANSEIAPQQVSPEVTSQAPAPAVTPQAQAPEVMSQAQAPEVASQAPERDANHPVTKMPDAMITQKNLAKLEKALESYSDLKIDKTPQLDNGQPYLKVNAKEPDNSFYAYQDKLTTNSSSEQTYKAMLECWKETHPDGKMPQINVTTPDALIAMQKVCKDVYPAAKVEDIVKLKTPQAAAPTVTPVAPEEHQSRGLGRP